MWFSTAAGQDMHLHELESQFTLDYGEPRWILNKQYFSSFWALGIWQMKKVNKINKKKLVSPQVLTSFQKAIKWIPTNIYCIVEIRSRLEKPGGKYFP